VTVQTGVKGWLAAYGDRRVFIVLILGLVQGLPLALTGSTLAVWLTEEKVSLTTIGAFALVGLAYILKPLWAPVIDYVPPPFLARLGRRRGWGIIAVAAVLGATLLLGASDPAADPLGTAIKAAFLAFCAATLDIVIDAYRIEILPDEKQGAGSAVFVYGYRIGMLISGSGALFLATFFGWFITYAVMAALMAIVIVGFLLLPEPTPPPQKQARATTVAGHLDAAVVEPLRSFMRAQPLWIAILAFIILFKFGDALAGVMTNPFYISIGFTKIHIASVSKVWGVIATMMGVFVGGWLVARYGVLKALLIGGVLQLLSNFVFILQAWAGPDLVVLSGTVFVENAAAGIGAAPFVAYLSRISQREFSGTHYAMLSALSAWGRTLLSSSGGWFAEHLGWIPFFLLTTAAAVPGLIVLVWLMQRGAALPVVAAGEPAAPSGR
jgi:PAT family beta-lactamase induction signal transducer AmpG